MVNHICGRKIIHNAICIEGWLHFFSETDKQDGDVFKTIMAANRKSNVNLPISMQLPAVRALRGWYPCLLSPSAARGVRGGTAPAAHQTETLYCEESVYNKDGFRVNYRSLYTMHPEWCSGLPVSLNMRWCLCINTEANRRERETPQVDPEKLGTFQKSPI
ncbi:hypothetical protein CBL_05302 [Carabus blaptoides fortunei]